MTDSYIDYSDHSMPFNKALESKVVLVPKSPSHHEVEETVVEEPEPVKDDYASRLRENFNQDLKNCDISAVSMA